MVLSLLILLSSIISGLISANAFKSHIIGGNNPHRGGHHHEDVTTEGLSFQGLSFLKRPILRDILDEHGFVDLFLQFYPAYHFDTCNFQRSTENINRHYLRAIRDIETNNMDDSRDAFGQLLHIVQDFYTHSNWIESGNVDPQADLVDNGLGLWTVMRPFQKHQVLYMIVEGKNVPSDIQLTRSGKVITVRTPSENLLGITTGAAYRNNNCPDIIVFGHWDNKDGRLNLCCSDREQGQSDFGTGLNKDEESRPNYNESRAMAVAQTTHEWCRLVSLVNQQLGQQGVDRLFSNWVEDRTSALSVCSQ